jgi:hypothetical protein
MGRPRWSGGAEGGKADALVSGRHQIYPPFQPAAQPRRAIARAGDAHRLDRARWLREVDSFITGFAERAATWDYFLGDFDDDRLHHDAGRPQLELFPLRVGWR